MCKQLHFRLELRSLVRKYILCVCLHMFMFTSGQTLVCGYLQGKCGPVCLYIDEWVYICLRVSWAYACEQLGYFGVNMYLSF